MAASLPVVCINDESFRDTVINDLNGFVFNNRREYKRDILKLYLKLGGTIITIGSDSHQEDHLGAYIEDTKKELKEIAFAIFQAE